MYACGSNYTYRPDIYGFSRGLFGLLRIDEGGELFVEKVFLVMSKEWEMDLHAKVDDAVGVIGTVEDFLESEVGERREGERGKQGCLKGRNETASRRARAEQSMEVWEVAVLCKSKVGPWV